MSNSLILLKNPIPGYNNNLKIATQDMVFGLNSNLNYSGIINEQKKVHQELAYHHLQPFGKKKKTKQNSRNHTLETLGKQK